MKNIKEAIKDVREWSLREILNTGSPPLELHKICVETAHRLAKKNDVDVEVITLGIELIDIKLGESIKKGEVKNHVKISEDAAKEFLNKYDIDNKMKENVLSCIREHHGNVFSSKESEICANADCYKFLTLKGFILFTAEIKEREDKSFNEALKYAYEKYKEKKKILTLEYSKKELESEMKIIYEIAKLHKLE